MPRLSVRLPNKLAQDVEELIPTSSYKNKSDLTRSLLRWWVSANKIERKVTV